MVNNEHKISTLGGVKGSLQTNSIAHL
uniref:Uncharacterized protein n=1 Tax=Anguilla anguilla TaxID=7936 RepID=A0A0E9QIG7_ANGAN